MQKRRYGHWMLPAFRLLSRCKGLRGTRLDPFGHTEERRAERRLIEEYFSLVDRFCRQLDIARLPVAVELARLPEQIRGFGHVKERSVVAAEEKRKQLLERFAIVRDAGMPV